MNTIWADDIQGVMTLYLSRKLRFDDIFKENYDKLFGIDKSLKLKILEIGCGPGSLAESLHRWYPNAEIVGVDRDTKFIKFSRENIKGVEFIEADITKLPFPDDYFDVTISNTVQEHIDPEFFWGEQKRVLKNKGKCICISSRKTIEVKAKCLKKTQEEIEFWDKIENENNILEKYNIGKYKINESEIPLKMEKYGFKNIKTGYVMIDLTPDNPKYDEEFAIRMIESERIADLEAVESVKSNNSIKVIKAINQKYDERIRLYKQGKKQWDTINSIIMILTGEK